MKKYRTISAQTQHLCTTEEFTGESIEEKVRRTMESNAPIEAISPMVYTERKEGVRPEMNIRTDKWDIAQQAMDTIATGIRKKREERIKGVDKPSANSEMNVQSGNASNSSN